MAKKVLMTDNKLSWIRDTTADDVKPSPERKPKAENLPGKKSVEEKSTKTVEEKSTKTKVATKEPVSKLAARHPAKHETAPKPNTPTKRPQSAPVQTKHMDTQPAEQQKVEQDKPLPHPSQDTHADIPPSYHAYSTPAGPTEESPMIVLAENKKQGKLLYYVSIVALLCVAIFFPERYSIFVFLGFIFIALIEISYRVGAQYHLLKTMSENLATLLKLLNKQ